MAMDFMAGPAAPPAPPPPDMGMGGPGPGAGPDLAALLGGMGPPPEAAEPLGPETAEPPAEPASEVDAIDDIMAACDTYLTISSVDESERLEVEKIKTMLQSLKAKNEKMGDQVAGTSPALRKLGAGLNG